jgi:AraC-like DNA-binding protein
MRFGVSRVTSGAPVAAPKEAVGAYRTDATDSACQASRRGKNGQPRRPLISIGSDRTNAALRLEPQPRPSPVSPGSERRSGARASRRDVVERAEAYMRAHLDAPVSISRLCRVLGYSERGLRNAFYNVRGKSPKRCLLIERLESVRRALLNRSTEPTTVTGVAADYGFYELGRFAATYKEAFGEAPSETLRGLARRSACLRPESARKVRHVCISS